MSSQSRGADPGTTTSTVRSAQRALDIIEALAARAGTPTRLRDVAAQLGIPRSSAHALLRTMVAKGWVRTDATGTLYSLGLEALVVGTRFLDADPYVRAAGPILSDLRDTLQETIHLARLDGNSVVYLATFESGREIRKVSRVGRRLPAASTSLGKALLAERGDQPAGPFEAITSRTLITPEALADDLKATRERGYAIDREENTLGLICVGVALPYTTPVVDAISCSMPSSRAGEERIAQVASALQAARMNLVDAVPLLP